MILFLYDHERDYELAPSFLESASAAHFEPIKSLDWFLWKFIERPSGSILACAADQNKIVACVAFAPQIFKSSVETISSAISYETFVHPNYQRRGLFSELLKLAEAECYRREVDFLINFPNINSIDGFKKNKWQELKQPLYIIYPKYTVKSFLYSRFIKNEFKICKHTSENVSSFDNLNQHFGEKLKPLFTKNYIFWRFLSQNKSYGIVEYDQDFLLYRVGKRGKLIEVQVLMLELKNVSKQSLNKIISQVKSKLEYHILSFLLSSNHQVARYMSFPKFISVPNNTNVCFKSLKNLKPAFLKENINFESSLYHTY
ncbi:MAG: GNAT family N-acetyltransferase [Nonlabens sp.]